MPSPARWAATVLCKERRESNMTTKIRNRRRRSVGEVSFRIINGLILIFLAFIMLYPFWELLVVSISPSTYAARSGLKLWPVEGISGAAYKTVLANSRVLLAYKNTIFRTVVGTVAAILMYFMAAYPLSKQCLPFRRFFNLFYLIPMFFSGGLIPEYLNLNSLGLIDTIWVLILPCLMSTYNLLIVRNFVAGIPESLEESARVDGASFVRILFHIIMPLSLPVLATVALWVAVGHWNAWYDAMVYTHRQDLIVLQRYLRDLILTARESTNDSISGAESVLPRQIEAATTLVALGPILLAYPFVQKYFVKGVMVGSVKG